jgi:outer membrane protein OmpA-like peptidoglycan-associated protein
MVTTCAFPRPAAVAALVSLALICATPLIAQNGADEAPGGERGIAVKLRLAPLQSYSVQVSYNLRSYRGGEYAGLLHREVRGRVSSAGEEEDSAAAGETGPRGLEATYFVLEETYRDTQKAAKQIERRYRTQLTRAGDGSVSVEGNSPLPRRRGFPASPDDPVTAGDTWSAPATLVLDPLWSGELHSVRIEPKYRFTGRETYKGRAVYRVTARYGFRYRADKPEDGRGDEPALVESRGSHTSVILIDVESGRPVLIRDRIEERHRFADRPERRFRGFALTWYTEPPPFDTSRVAEQVERELQLDSKRNIEVTSTTEGVRIRLERIHFVADKAEILPEERERLDAVARALKQYPNRSFLVVGHTAGVGKPEGQKQLSVARAKTVVGELARRGIARDRFLYEGRGATEPIASNETAEGRARNRRVEIVILK